VNDMKSAGILLFIVLVLGLYIFLRFIIQRICFLVKLERFAEKYGFYVKKKFWNCLLPLNGSSNSSIVIETESSVYDIKLFGLFLKHCEIHFWNTRLYSVEWYFSRHGLRRQPTIGKTCAKMRRSLGNFNDTSSIDTSSQKERISILLITPTNAPVRITQLLGYHVVYLRAGDKIGDVLFADWDFLLRYIVKRETL